MEVNLTGSNQKREYKRVSNEERANLIHMVEYFKLSISKASTMLGINYTNAMSIMRIYRRENRAQSIRPIHGHYITGGQCHINHQGDKEQQNFSFQNKQGMSLIQFDQA